MKPFSQLRVLKKERRPVRFLLSRILSRFGFWRFFRIAFPGYSLRLHPAAVSLRLWVDRDSRNDDVNFIRALLRPGDTYIDIGANIGQLALAASTCVGSNGKVYAFEPHPRTILYLRDNIALNGITNVVTAHAAVGARAGWCMISDGPSDDQNRVGNTGFCVLQIRLDDFFPHVPVRLLKIDVEGYEEEVLRGCEGLLQSSEFVYFESCEEHATRYGSTCHDTIALLEQHGFSTFQLIGSVLHPVSRHDQFGVCRNLIATRDIDHLKSLIAFSFSA
jgi:FkbM family methyltransferase